MLRTIDKWIETRKYRLDIFRDIKGITWSVLRLSDSTDYLEEKLCDTESKHAMVMNSYFRSAKYLPIGAGVDIKDSLKELECKIVDMEIDCAGVMLNTFLQDIKTNIV